MLQELKMLTELEQISANKINCLREEARLTTALLTNVNHIPVIYKWFCELKEEQSERVKESRSNMNKQFIFIINFLYSPASLVEGKRVKKGVRQKLSKVFDYKSPSAVSNLSIDLLFLYKKYADFADEVNRCYAEILKRLEENGIL